MNGQLPEQPPRADDFSAATTLITFPRPLPLLRGPIKAGPADDPSSGPYLLAFRSPCSWAAAYCSCKSGVISQCENGSRIGCSISASKKCKPPWWKWPLGLTTVEDLSERAKCEEVEMEACFVAARERCGEFAKQKCVPAFKDARIVVSGLDLKSIQWKEVFRLVSGVYYVNEKGDGYGNTSEVTNVRGSDILGSDEDIEDYIRKQG